MTGHELLVLAAVVAALWWAIRAYFWPFAKCRACKGAKTNPGSSSKRYGLCKACKGTGSRQVLGARTVHQTVQHMRARTRRQWR